MKRTYRHRLKTNEVASVLDRTVEMLTVYRDRVLAGVALVVVLGAIVGGYVFVRARTQAAVGSLMGQASVIMGAPVEPPPPPGQPSTPGSYPTEQAKYEAALQQYLEAADGYPNTSAGIAARYQAASLLARLGRPEEAAEQFQAVIDRTDDNSVYREMARLGKVSAQAQAASYDDAIATLEGMSAESGEDVPQDAVLMELGRVYLLAGRMPEARQTFRRLLDEYPASQFAPEAQREFDALEVRG